MKVSNDVYLSDYFVDSDSTERAIRAYFGRVRSGTDWIGRTNFGGRETPESEILDDWANHLEVISHKWPSLWDFENDLRKKVGPMSVMKPLDERMSDIDSYYESILLDSEPVWQDAVDATCTEWSAIRGLRLRGQIATTNSMRLNTNSGNPYFARKSSVIHKTVPCRIFRKDDSSGQVLLARNGYGDVWPCVAILGWRGQEGGPLPSDTKQRVVWMFPFALSVAELAFYQPLILGAQTRNLVPAWVSMDAVDAHVTQLFDTKDSKDAIICTDFSAFDQHFNKHCQDVAYYVINYLLTQSSSSDYWLRNVFPVKYDIPLMISESSLIRGSHGMASGSGGTNADETLLHRTLQHEAAMKAGKQLNPYSQCLGDDGMLSYPGIRVEHVVDSYSAHGLEMNPDKQSVSSEHCTYLRRWYHQDYRVDGRCVGVYSTFRALGRLMHQERYYYGWSEKLVALRQLSILENCRFHPLRDQFADFCMERDSRRLGLDIPGFIDNLRVEAAMAMDDMPDFLGYTKSLQYGSDVTAGIDTWWITQYLRSKA